MVSLKSPSMFLSWSFTTLFLQGFFEAKTRPSKSPSRFHSVFSRVELTTKNALTEIQRILGAVYGAWKFKGKIFEADM